MKSLLALLGILLLGTTLVVEAQAQSSRDDILRRRNGNGGASRDRNRGNDRSGRVDRGRRDDRGSRDVRRPVNDRRNPDVRRPGNDTRNPDVRRPRNDRRDPNVGRDSRRPNPGRRYTRHNHNPRRDYVRHNRRYNRRYDYHRTIPYRFVYNNRWVRFSVNFGNGYTTFDGYPYYVYNGYRHRYSHYDICDYELVDSYSNRVERTFYGYTCAQSYDYCAQLRDDLNYGRNGYQFFCSEKIEFDYGRRSFDHWNY